MKNKKRFGEELLIAVLLIGVLAGVVAGVAIYAFAYPIFQSQIWAAWVQAIGSIAAIWFAVSVSRKELKQAIESERRQAAHFRKMAKQQRKAKIQAEVSKIDAVDYLCRGVLQSIHQCLNDARSLESGKTFAKYCDSAQKQAVECMTAVDQIPVYSPPYSYFAPEIVRLRQLTDEVLASVCSVSSAILEKTQGGDLLEEHLKAIQGVRDLVNPRLEHLSGRLDSAKQRAVLSVNHSHA